MNQIERQARRQKSNDRIWRNVLRSWVVLGTVTFLVGVAAGVAIAGCTQAAEVQTVAAADVPVANNFRKSEFVVMRTVPLSVELQKHVFKVAREYDLDEALLMAIMQKESRFDAQAVSAHGDYGLMQINRVNHRRLSVEVGVHDFLNPYENISAGAYLLSQLMAKYGDVHKALMAYNMGEAGAAACWERGVITSAYSREVVGIWQALKAANREVRA